MEESEIKGFINTYCSIPPEPKSLIVSVTKEEIINNFISYIKDTCSETHTLIKYKMPAEFYGKIEKNEFWEIIVGFIDYKMNFDNYNLGEHKAEPVYDTDYTNLKYGQYFLVSEKKYEEYDGYIEDWIALQIDKVDKIIFRIYKK